jgi:hypothetical protein
MEGFTLFQYLFTYPIRCHALSSGDKVKCAKLTGNLFSVIIIFIILHIDL